MLCTILYICAGQGARNGRAMEDEQAVIGRPVAHDPQERQDVVTHFQNSFHQHRGVQSGLATRC